MQGGAACTYAEHSHTRWPMGQRAATWAWPCVRWAVLTIVFAFLAAYIRQNWQQVRAADWTLNPGGLAAALAVFALDQIVLLGVFRLSLSV